MEAYRIQHDKSKKGPMNWHRDFDDTDRLPQAHANLLARAWTRSIEKPTFLDPWRPRDYRFVTFKPKLLLYSLRRKHIEELYKHGFSMYRIQFKASCKLGVEDLTQIAIPIDSIVHEERIPLEDLLTMFPRK